MARVYLRKRGWKCLLLFKRTIQNSYVSILFSMFLFLPFRLSTFNQNPKNIVCADFFKQRLCWHNFYYIFMIMFSVVVVNLSWCPIYRLHPILGLMLEQAWWNMVTGSHWVCWNVCSTDRGHMVTGRCSPVLGKGNKRGEWFEGYSSYTYYTLSKTFEGNKRHFLIGFQIWPL